MDSPIRRGLKPVVPNVPLTKLTLNVRMDSPIRRGLKLELDAKLPTQKQARPNGLPDQKGIETFNCHSGQSDDLPFRSEWTPRSEGD